MAQRPNGSLERQSQAKQATVGQLRLKPSQIVQDAKKEQNMAEELNHREGSSLAVLLQGSQSQPVFKPMAKSRSSLPTSGN